ncbi:MAG: LuxR family transcriptional regulator [Proteobacteria bacterium]|nr:LuxR family transcriptional regulator [Pseudomonadota bacterium]
MHRIFQAFIDGLAESSDEEGLRTTMEFTATALDLSCFAYLVVSNYPRAKARLISNYPAAWTTHYLERHYELLDPVIVQAIAEQEPFEWGRDIGPATLSKEQRELFEQAAFFGIRHGYTIPIHDNRGPVAALTFASPEREPTFGRCIERNGRVLQFMAMCFHVHARRKIVTDRHVDGVLLSRRELESLQWAAFGKSAWDTSVILGIKRRTVAFHLENAKAKLEVRTIQQAVGRLAASKLKMH